MSVGWLIGLTRARVFFLFAGLAWVFGLQAPLLVRLALVVLAAVAVAGDGLLDEQRIAHSAKTTVIPPQRTRT